jgi:hypothetical protein
MDHNDVASGKLPLDLEKEGRKVQRNIVNPRHPQLLGKEKQSRQAALDEIWAKFRHKHPGKGKQQSFTLVEALSNMIVLQFQRSCHGTYIQRKEARTPQKAR